MPLFVSQRMQLPRVMRMNDTQRKVSTNDELGAALSEASVKRIRVCGRLTHLPSIRLKPGQSLVGDDASASILEFAPGDGYAVRTALQQSTRA
jgi:hypothetical protein